MLKKQQMQWSLHGAYTLMQVRTAALNGERHDRLKAPFRQPERTCLRYSNPSHPFCALPDPREVSGLQIEETHL